MLRADAPAFSPQAVAIVNAEEPPSAGQQQSRSKRKVSKKHDDGTKQQQRRGGRRQRESPKNKRTGDNQKDSDTTRGGLRRGGTRRKKKNIRRRVTSGDDEIKMHDTNTSTKNQNPFTEAEAFPVLGSSKHHGGGRSDGDSPPKKSSIWCEQTAKEVLFQPMEEDRQKSPNEESPYLNFESSLTQLPGRLTVLRKQPVSPSKAVALRPEHPQESTDQDRTPAKDKLRPSKDKPEWAPDKNNDEQHSTSTFRSSGKRRLDMAKLRDRWWDLVKNRPLLPPAEDCDSNDSGSGSEEEKEYVSDDPVCYNHINAPAEGVPVEDKIDFSYSTVDDPILEAVRRDDSQTLKALLSRSQATQPSSAADSQNQMSPLQLATHLNRPHLVRPLVAAARKGTSFHVDSPRFQPALLVAAEQGYEECLQILLSRSSSLVTATKDLEGNNVLHACCRGPKSTSSTMDIILYAGASSVAKLLLATNHRRQTPFHVACRCGRVDLVDMLLSSWSSSSTGSFTLLSKILAMQDVEQQTPLLAAVASGATDVVMSLLMWRGNNSSGRGGGFSSTNSKAPCALSWAVKSRDVDMVLLLLEFSDPSGTGYDLTGALRVAVADRQKVLDEEMDRVSLEIIRVLVNAGANPCDISTPRQQEVSRSAVAIAADQHDAEAVTTLLSSYESFLDRVRMGRRRDPVLSQQPESFFAGMESRENGERKAALLEALVTSLFLTSQIQVRNQPGSSPSDSTHLFHECTMALYKSGARLGSVGLARLESSLRRWARNPSMEFECSMNTLVSYEASYEHLVPASFQKRDDKMKALGYWSRIMMHQSWALEDWGCSWVRSKRHPGNKVVAVEPDFVLVAEDGTRFDSHSHILSQKSGKLAAAYRFACMSQNQASAEGENTLPETQVAMPSRMCSFLLHHIYHGSLPYNDKFHAWESIETRREELLELLLIGDEFICPSLVQECELRLVSTAEHANQCFCWYCCARRGPVRESDKLVNCYFTTTGGTSSDEQAYYVTPDVALDVLAISQHVGQHFTPDAYTFDIHDKSRIGRSSRLTLHPMQALRSIAVHTILQEFVIVLESESFASQLVEKDNEDQHTQAWEMLLEMCLDELVELPGLLHQVRSASRGPTLPTLLSVDCFK